MEAYIADASYLHLTQRRALADDDDHTHGLDQISNDGDDFRDNGDNHGESSEDLPFNDEGTSSTNDEPAVARVEVDFKKMCDDRTDDEGTCTIKNGIIEVTKDSVYKNDEIVSLIFDNTKLACVNGDKYCDITI